MEIEVIKDKVIGTAGAKGRDLRADIYRPEQPNGAGVLIVHGGGWRMGSRDMVIGQALAERGFTCVATEYRFVQEAPWPAPLHDVKTAMRWFRAHAAALGVDPDRIAASGNSAGGHLVLMLAGTVGDAAFEGAGGHPDASTHVAAVIAIFPCVAFYVGERTSGANNAEAILGASPDPEVARLASPINYVRPDFPPTFLLHGNGDKVVPVSASINMYNALTTAGAKAEMHIYAEQPHSWARWPHWVGPTMGEAAIFLERYLLPSHPYGNPGVFE
jgi:acetyl esterase/lipase